MMMMIIILNNMHVERCQRLYRVDKVVQNTLEWQTSKFHNQASLVHEQKYLHLNWLLMVLFLKQQSWGFNLVKLCQIRFSKQDLVVKLLVWRKHAWRRLLWEDRIERRKTVIPAVERRGGAGRRTAPYSYLYLIELSISVLGYVKWTSIEWRGIVICSSHIHLTKFRLKCSNLSLNFIELS